MSTNALVDQNMERTIKIRISNLMVTELDRECAWQRTGRPVLTAIGKIAFECTLNLVAAESLREFCGTQRRKPDLRHGLRKAYGHVIENVTLALREIEMEGTFPDPGYDAAFAEARDSGCKLRVGSVCINTESDVSVEVVKPYGFYGVTIDDGPFVTSDGQRCAYQWGYLVRELGGDTYFLPAHHLVTANYSQTHLTLCRVNGAGV